MANTTPKFLQRLVGQVVELQKNLEVWREASGNNEKTIEQLQAENERLKDAIQAIIDHEEDRKKCGCGYDLFVHDTAVMAIVF